MENFTDVDDVIRTQKRAPSIVFEGFTFRKDKKDEKGHLLFWRCRHKECPGRLVSDVEMKKAKVIKPHRGHLPNAKVAEGSKIVERVKERVMKEKVPVNRTHHEETRCVAGDTKTLDSLPTFESIKSVL